MNESQTTINLGNRPRRENEITGLEYANGNLVALRPDPNNQVNNVIRWIFLCKLCGNEKALIKQGVLIGETKSCGCKRLCAKRAINPTDDEFIKAVASSKSQREVAKKLGYQGGNPKALQHLYARLKPDISHFVYRKGRTKDSAEIAKNIVFASYRKNSIRKNREFKLTFEDFSEIVSKNCYYCGQEPKPISRTNKYKANINGIDRIDSNVGYTIDNCVACCTECNFMKGTLRESIFILKIKQILIYKGYKILENNISKE